MLQFSWDESGPKDLLFASHPAIVHPEPSLIEKVSEMEELHDAAAIFRSHPDFAAPESLLPAIKDLIGSGKFALMSPLRRAAHPLNLP
jgi:hypothetical protein